MRKAQIYIKNIKKQNKLHLVRGQGCCFSNGGLCPPRGWGGVKISLQRCKDRYTNAWCKLVV